VLLPKKTRDVHGARRVALLTVVVATRGAKVGRVEEARRMRFGRVEAAEQFAVKTERVLAEE
jgi:hypothetical protein